LIADLGIFLNALPKDKLDAGFQFNKPTVRNEILIFYIC